MLYIRADGNTEIGMGHVMRCLSVAEAAADFDCQHPPVFITADEGCCGLIRDRGFRTIVLDTDYRDMMGELPRLERLFHDKSSYDKSSYDKSSYEDSSYDKPSYDRSSYENLSNEISSYGSHSHTKQDVLLVDSYQVSREYYLALRKHVMVACFEDMGEAYPVDLLINYNIYAPWLEQNYMASGQDDNAAVLYPQNVLLGASYMPLRKAFQEPAVYELRNKVTNVTITTGGSDPCFAAAAITDALRSDSDLVDAQVHWNIISGPFNRFADQLKHRYQKDANITIHENVKDMKSLLLNSDVVISATGSTIYEVSSIGVPMIVFYFAENQRQGAEALGTYTDIVNAGCFAEDDKAVTERIREALKRCVSDQAYRKRLYKQEIGLIDGKGAQRIAGQLIRLITG